jgi:hypothetical protein
MKKGAFMMMFGQVIDKPRIFISEFCGFLGKTDTGRIYNGQIIAKDL